MFCFSAARRTYNVLERIDNGDDVVGTVTHPLDGSARTRRRSLPHTPRSSAELAAKDRRLDELEGLAAERLVEIKRLEQSALDHARQAELLKVDRAQLVAKVKELSRLEGERLIEIKKLEQLVLDHVRQLELLKADGAQMVELLKADQAHLLEPLKADRAQLVAKVEDLKADRAQLVAKVKELSGLEGERLFAVKKLEQSALGDARQLEFLKTDRAQLVAEVEELSVLEGKRLVETKKFQQLEQSALDHARQVELLKADRAQLVAKVEDLKADRTQLVEKVEELSGEVGRLSDELERAKSAATPSGWQSSPRDSSPFSAHRSPPGSSPVQSPVIAELKQLLESNQVTAKRLKDELNQISRRSKTEDWAVAGLQNVYKDLSTCCTELETSLHQSAADFDQLFNPDTVSVNTLTPTVAICVQL